MRRIKAVYENGVFRPLEDVSLLRQRQRVDIVVNGEPGAGDLARLAEKAGSFDFLMDQKEDVYSAEDGEAV